MDGFGTCWVGLGIGRELSEVALALNYVVGDESYVELLYRWLEQSRGSDGHVISM